MEAYCVKCKAKREMKNPKVAQTAKGGWMAKGQCPECGTNMAKILSADQAKKLK